MKDLKQEALEMLEKLEKAQEPLFISFEARSGKSARVIVWGNPGFIARDFQISNLGSGWEQSFLFTLAQRAGVKKPVINWGARLYY